MDDDKDSRLAGPYQQTPREEPPARVDRSAMELSRTSVRRRSLVPSGNRWMVAAALAGTRTYLKIT
ncbi:MAG TPA: hypothetical protein VET88_00760 [Gammaproteobacteria bacterium]|nr:hypothetical protein [Gammaproteobacteria bacterium]